MLTISFSCLLGSIRNAKQKRNCCETLWELKIMLRRRMDLSIKRTRSWSLSNLSDASSNGGSFPLPPLREKKACPIPQQCTNNYCQINCYVPPRCMKLDWLGTCSDNRIQGATDWHHKASLACIYKRRKQEATDHRGGAWWVIENNMKVSSLM